MSKKRFSTCLILLGWAAMSHAALQMDGPKNEDDPLVRGNETAEATVSSPEGDGNG